MKLTHKHDNQCPHCQYKTDRVSEFDDRGSLPKPGDVSFCIKCYDWSVYDQNLRLRKPTVEEIGYVTINPRFQVMIKAIETFKKSAAIAEVLKTRKTKGWRL